MAEKEEETVRELRICPQVLLGFGSGVFQVIANPLPSDAKVVSVAIDEHEDHLVLQISSSKFSPSEAGRPLLPIHFRRLR